MLGSMLFVLVLGISLKGQTDCRTPLGVPCYTIESRQTVWTMFETGITDFAREVTYSVEALRRDGAVAGTAFDAQRKPGRRWLRLATDQSIVINPRRQEATVQPSYPPARRSEAGDKLCVTGVSSYYAAPPAFTYVGTDRVAGVPVVVYRKAGTSWRWAHEVAMAPSLDCLPLRTLTRNIPDLLGGDRASVITMEAVSIKLGEPTDELFAIPAGYRTVTVPQPSPILDFLGKHPQVLLHPR